MDYTETKQLLKIAIASYPTTTLRDDMKPTAKIWSAELEDIPCKIAEEALKRHISTSTYFPAVADIKQVIADMATANNLPAEKAFRQVSDFCDSFDEHQGYQNDWKEVDPLAREIACDLGLGELQGGGSSTRSVWRTQFMKLYDERQKERYRQLRIDPAKAIPMIAASTRRLLAVNDNG